MERTIRYSKKREAILEAIRGTDTHPTADWVYQTLKPTHPDLSLGTVYRNISFFKEQGTVCCVGVVNGQERFDATVAPHTHFICDGCGAVSDLHEIPVDTALDAEVGKHYDLEVHHHDLVFHGQCRACNAKRDCLS